MNKSRWLRRLPFAALLLSAAAPLSAMQVGVGGGASEGRDDERDHNPGTHYTIKNNQGGLMLNFGADNPVFQYRLELDWVNGRLEDFRNGSIPLGGRESYEGFLVGNHFGFKLGSSTQQTLWIGPSVYAGEMRFDDTRRDASLVAVGGTIGLDFPLSGGGTLTTSLTYREGELRREDGDPAPDRHFQEPLFRVGLLFGR